MYGKSLMTQWLRRESHGHEIYRLYSESHGLEPPVRLNLGGVVFPSKLNWKQQIQWSGFYEICWQ